MAMSKPSVWKSRIDKWTSAYHEVESRHDEARKFYHNQFPRGLVTVNLVFSFGRSMVPQLYFKNPSVTVLIKGENAPMSRLLQEADVELIRQMNLKKTLKKMIVSAFITGRGIGKLGFESDDMPVFDPSSMVKPRQPWFLHVLTKNWAHDLTPNGEIDDVPWAGNRVALTVDQIDKLLDGRRPPESLQARIDGLPDDNPDETIDFFELYDRGEGRWGLLYEDAWLKPPDVFKVWPYYGLEFNWTPEEAIPVSDAELILQIQKEYNENETQIHEHRRIAVMKLLARKGIFKTEEKGKLENGTVGVLVEVDTSDALDSVVKELTPAIPETLLLAKKTLQDDARDVIGFSRNQLGEFQGSASSRRTFGEAAIVQQALQIRLDERRDMTAEVIEQVVRASNQIVFKEWNADDAKRYAGVADPAAWQQLARIEQDDYSITVVPDSTLPLTKAVRRQQGIEMFAALKGDPLIDQVELRKNVLESFEGIDPDKLMNQEAIAALKQTSGALGINPAMILQMIQGAQGQQGGQGGPPGQRRQPGRGPMTGNGFRRPARPAESRNA